METKVLFDLILIMRIWVIDSEYKIWILVQKMFESYYYSDNCICIAKIFKQ